MNIAIPDRYLLAADFETRAMDLDLPVEVWTVAAELAEVSEPTSSAELEKLTRQSPAQVREALDRLLAKKLVRQNLVSWKDFSAARAKARGAAKNGQHLEPAPSATKPAPPRAELSAKSSAVPNGHLPAQDGVALRLGTITPQKVSSDTTKGWVWQKPDPAVVASSMAAIPAASLDADPVKGYRLRPLLAQIENLKGGGVEGQLLVYQVFLRVPFQLLHDEGIKSLQLVDERTVIQNPVLHAAIAKAAKEVTGLDLALMNGTC